MPKTRDKTYYISLFKSPFITDINGPSAQCSAYATSLFSVSYIGNIFHKNLNPSYQATYVKNNVYLALFLTFGTKGLILVCLNITEPIVKALYRLRH